MRELTLKEARGFIITYQGLDRKSKSNPKESILDIVDRLGCLQYDPLNVVGRNPDLVLQSRINNYKARYLSDLLYQDRKLIDAWDKMMAIYQTTDWPYFMRVRLAHTKGTVNTLKYRNSLDALELTDSIYDYIKDHGPLQSSKLKSDSSSKSRWGHRKHSSAALDYLYAIGSLGIHSKINTQKLYDLIENIVPEEFLNLDDPFVNDEAFLDWYVLRRIDSIGLLWNKNGGAWLGYHIQPKATRSKSIGRLLDKELIIPIRIDSINEEFYITTKSLPKLEAYLSNDKARPKQVRFIAPLDNLMWDRGLIEAVFGFVYRWEVYSPVVKREFGYYVLPILYGHNLVGRIEFDYYRGGESVSIINTWFEPGFKRTKGFEKAFKNEINNFTKYLKSSTK